jgi:triose/dihydroxyacetone kinase / FAD-AMP lyase (cyclizing)
MGIHNEPGVRRLSQPPLSQLLSQIAELLTSTNDPERSYLPFRHDGKDEVVLMVNNLGGTSELELSGVAGMAYEELRKRRIGVKRMLVGTYMVSCSITSL